MVYDGNEAGRRIIRKQSCWSKRSCLERCEILVLTIATLLIIGLVTFFVLIINKNKTETDQSSDKVQPTSSTCLTPGCIQAASNVLKYIDPSINPCDDFYQFACGRFIQETVIPDDKIQVNSFTLAGNIVQQQLKSLIKEPSKPDEPRPFVLIKKLFNVCMDTRAIENEGFGTIRTLLKNLGGWPVVENKTWNEKDFNWQKSVALFRKYGLSTNNFITFGVTTNSKNSSRNIMLLDQAELEINRASLLKGLKDNGVNAYREYMIKLAVLFGAEKGFAEYEVDNMLDFKIKLANISLPQEERRNDTALYNPMTVKELQDKYPSISWLELLNNVVALPDNAFTYEDTVIVTVPKYISDLEELLRKTSKRAQANHAIFQAIRFIEALLPEQIRNLEQQFDAIMYGAQTRTPKWDECVSVASNAFNIAMGALYVRKYFKEDARQNAMEMVAHIRNEFINILREVDWMDEETKQKAVEKALAMTAHIAYSDELLDDKKITEYYSELQITSDNYITFMGNISVFRSNKTMKELWKPVNKSDWTMRAPPMTINAYYSLTENSIQFPAAILQGTFFNKDRLHSMNFGAIGTIIGHEMTHGFDDEGKQYDKEGNLKNWWAEKTHKAFVEKAKCIIDQYGQYTEEEVGLQLNGINTQGENIADNGGIKEAYLAYNAWVRRNGEEPHLPGLNYTAKQMFWISTAHVWCTKDRQESLKQDILTDDHSPARFRILGPLSNSEYFAQDFQCPRGSKMNPEHKCQVW